MLIVVLSLAYLLYRDIFLAKGTRRMILEPILDTVLVKVVSYVAGEGNHTLLRLELAKANAALILIC